MAARKSAVPVPGPARPHTEKQQIIDWDGPDDPDNPRNWRATTKMVHVCLVSAFTLYANLASVMFAPGAEALCAEFGITNSTVAALTVTIYVLGFALGPLFISPLSEIYGWLIVYTVGNGVHLAFTIGCALSTNTAMFMVFRFMCGVAAASPMSIGGGTIADLYRQEERGKAMSLFGLGPLLGPCIGPVIGGFVTEYVGWRWTFWIVLIFAGIISGIALAFMRETYEPVILQRKAARSSKSTGSNNFHPRTSELHPNGASRRVLLRAFIRPTKMLVLSPVILMMSLYSAFMFGLIYLLFTTFPTVFEEIYGFSAGIAGIVYLGLGLGMIVGIVLFGKLSDKLVVSARGGTAGRPELRLILMIWATPVIPVGFFWYGWSAFAKSHWIVPIVGTFCIGAGAFLLMMPAQIYLVDAFGTNAVASALAANTVLRSLAGTFLPFAGAPLYARLGLGWGNSLLAFLALAFLPVPVLFYKFGERLRKRFPVDY
ncbi:major facilitator superfamily domain-containing protein [Diaporthe sp. PMI_573]|nr:major facilitator superfamily domain-containing protein [Diaporthaceae sp. PMI_573]